MSKYILVGVLAAIASSPVSAFTPVNNEQPSRSALGIGSSFVPLDMSALPYLTSSLTSPNSYTQTFAGAVNNFSGTLTAEVFGNVGVPGPGLNQVLMVYTFVGDGAPLIRANGAESFEFGVNTSIEVDYAALVAATHGKITNESFLQSGQLNPLININDFVSGNDTFLFNYNTGGTGRLFELGGNTVSNPGPTETFTWYVLTQNADVAINFVDVRIADFGFTTIRSLALVNNPDQPNINIPAPGFAGLLAAGLLAAARRRR